MATTKKTVNTPEELLAEALVPEDEQPYPLPEKWVWVRLGGITKVIGGGTPKTTEKNYFVKGNIPWITPADLSNYNNIYIFSGKRNITKKGLDHSSARLLPKNTILLSSRAPIGYVAIAGNELSTNQGFKSFLPSNALKPHFGYWYLKNSTGLIDSFASGTTFREISGKKACLIPLPLPPLPEQGRITERLESLLGKIARVRELLEEARAGFETRRAAILHKAFTGELTRAWREERRAAGERLQPAEELLREIWEEKKAEAATGSGKRGRKLKVPESFEEFLADARVPEEDRPYPLPEGWEWVRFNYIADVITNLVDPSLYSDYPHIAPDNIEKKTGRLLEFRTIEEDSMTSAKHLFQSGQILYSKIRPYLSKAIIVDFEGLCSADMYPIDSKINSYYLLQFMLSEIFLSFVNKSGSRSLLPKINQKELAVIPLPICSRYEQEMICINIKQLFQNETDISNLLVMNEKLNYLENSILARAFRGELGTGNDEDEPALEMLKRELVKRSSSALSKTAE